MSQLVIGCCGWAAGQQEYFQLFDAIELQQTFYKPPRLGTAERWRDQAPDEFAFTMKAWQLITHPASSPTYRKAKIDIPAGERDKYGFFRPTEQVIEAWQRTREIAEAVQAAVIVFQCPASFRPTEENVDNLRAFFAGIGKQPFELGWEPRGKWPAELVKSLCDELGLIHIVDPFAATPTTAGTLYYRLHGIGGYRYEYSDEDLKNLLAMCPGDRLVYVMFNNVQMRSDALRFKQLADRRRGRG